MLGPELTKSFSAFIFFEKKSYHNRKRRLIRIIAVINLLFVNTLRIISSRVHRHKLTMQAERIHISARLSHPGPLIGSFASSCYFSYRVSLLWQGIEINSNFSCKGLVHPSVSFGPSYPGQAFLSTCAVAPLS
jgi:hypothetical protein